jgi:hypothetical protein
MTDAAEDVPDTSPTGEPAVCAAARALVGLTAPSQAYAEAIAPGETMERQTAMMAMSGCALLWRAKNGGEAPYVNGQAFADMWRLAGGAPWDRQATGSRVRVPVPGELPAPGDAVVYDRSPNGAFPQHVDYCWLGAGRAVAGGQRTGAGLETIAIVTRALTWVGGKLVDLHTERPVMALIAPP